MEILIHTIARGSINGRRGIRGEEEEKEGREYISEYLGDLFSRWIRNMESEGRSNRELR